MAMGPKTPPASPKRQYRKNTPLDPISANKIWADVCNKTERMDRKVGPFQLDIKHLIVLPEKPNHVVPDLKVTMKEYEGAIKLMEKVDPIKQREKVPPEKYELPLTVGQDYGWYSKPLVKTNPLFTYPKGMCEITEYADAYFRSLHRNPFQWKEPIVKDVSKGKGKEGGGAKPKAPKSPAN